MNSRIAHRHDAHRGQVAVLFAMCAVFVFGVVGLVVDAAMGYREERIQANAAALAARAATVFLAENQSIASDAQVRCVVTLYASEVEYETLADAGRCPSAATLRDNRGFVEFVQPIRGRSGAWYLDGAGNELAAVGTVDSALPVSDFLQATDGSAVAGIRVCSAVDAPTYFIRVLGIDQLHVAASAAYRLGGVSIFTPGRSLKASLPSPAGGMQNGISVFPAAFSQQSYAVAGLQDPLSRPVVETFSANDGTAGFFWSSLQCQSNSNADTKGWLARQDPCPAAGPQIATAATPSAQCASGGPGPASCVSTQPGIRDVDYRLSDPYVGQVVIVPIVGDASSETENPVLQFAYFYLAGYDARGANGSLSGYFIDPALMPVIPGAVGSGPGPIGVGGI